MRGDLLCSAVCPSPRHHVYSDRSPIRGVRAILAQPLLPAATFANGRPWHLALKPHSHLLACVQEDAVSSSACGLLWDVLGACPALCGGSQCNGGPGTTPSDGHSCTAGATEGCPHSGCPACRVGWPQFGALSTCCMKGQAGAFGAVFQRLTVWGPRPPPFSLPGAHTWDLSGKVIS